MQNSQSNSTKQITGNFPGGSYARCPFGLHSKKLRSKGFTDLPRPQALSRSPFHPSYPPSHLPTLFSSFLLFRNIAQAPFHLGVSYFRGVRVSSAARRSSQISYSASLTGGPASTLSEARCFWNISAGSRAPEPVTCNRLRAVHFAATAKRNHEVAMFLCGPRQGTVVSRSRSWEVGERGC